MNLVTKNMVDPEFKRLMSVIGQTSMDQGPWIAGGCARRLWFGKDWKAHDVDVFFRNREDHGSMSEHLTAIVENSIVSDHSVDELKWSGDLNLAPKSSSPIHRTENAISYKLQIGPIYPNVVSVQLIRKAFYGSISEVLERFDFTACKFATDGKIIIADQKAVEDCLESRLTINQSSKILEDDTRRLNVRRVIKYCIYGFKPEPAIMKEMVRQHRNLEILQSGSDDYD